MFGGVAKMLWVVDRVLGLLLGFLGWLVWCCGWLLGFLGFIFLIFFFLSFLKLYSHVCFWKHHRAAYSTCETGLTLSVFVTDVLDLCLC